MIEEIFETLPMNFISGRAHEKKSYYFSLGEMKRTVVLSRENCLVTNGKTVDKADCVCKTSQDFFLKIWQDGYRPGMKDFMSGTIKSNNPADLQVFLSAFGK